jgi:hypothetical protein
MSLPDYLAGMQHDDPAVSNAALVDLYLGGAAALRAGVSGLSPGQLTARPVPGRWSCLELVAHVADAEVYFTDRILRTLAMDRPLLVAADELGYLARIGYQSLDVEEELAVVTALRTRAARVLRQQPPEAWDRPAVHTESGLVMVRKLVFQATRHLRHHLPFLAEKRAALGLPS